MKRLMLFGAIAVFVVACGSSADKGSSGGTTAPPGQAALTIVIEPNPIVARSVGGDRYEFSFTAAIRETGGVAVEVQRVGIEAKALGGISLYSETLTRDQIVQKGYPTSIPAGGELRYTMSPQGSVPNDILFGAVSGEVFVEATDASGRTIRAKRDVTVTR